ncbi:MAG: hypothetical protein DHS20C10_07640 [marine bacterium B5-7]|nr:MAG: hypothetical protein DHS20C10_07640 [marine bacterium B5-7]
MEKNCSQAWTQSPLGRRVLRAEQQILQQFLADRWVESALWLNESAITPLPEQIVSCVKRATPTKTSCTDCVMQSDTLPFTHDVFDVVCLQHMLETADCPLTAVTEGHRVCAPDGLLILLTYNRCSLWQMARAKLGKRFCGWQVRKFLQPLSGEIVFHQTIFYRPYCQRESWLDRLKPLEWIGRVLWPAFGAVNVTIFKKHVVPLNTLHTAFVAPKLVLDNGILKYTQST